MNVLFKKLNLGEKLATNLFTIFVIAFGGAIIYGLPYFRYDYYEVYIETYNLTNTQMGIFGVMFGIFGMISYLFGGYVADRVSIKKIIVYSLVGTGVGGFVHLLPLNFIQLVILYAFWGVSSLFAFWPACIKAVRILSDEDGQGKAFGIFEGGRGVAAALSATLAVVFFRLGAKTDDLQGMKVIIIFYSVVTILCGVVAQFTLKDEVINDNENITFRDIGAVIKLPAVWIIALVTFCTYVFTLSLYYFVPYATSLLGMSVAGGAFLAAAKRYLAPVSNIGGGYLGDKFGASTLLFCSFIGMAISVIVMMVIPTSAPYTIIVYCLFYIIAYLFFQINYSLSWAMMEEGAIPKKYSGTAVGIISTIGYLPDVFVSLMAGSLLDKFPGAQGYQYFFGILVIILFIGAFLVKVWDRHLSKIK